MKTVGCGQTPGGLKTDPALLASFDLRSVRAPEALNFPVSQMEEFSRIRISKLLGDILSIF